MVYSSERSDGMLDASSGNHSGEVNNPSKEEENVWEHPWSTNEIRKNSSNWTLAGDVGLLNHLKQFSHKLISRTHEMEKVVDSLVHTSKVASVKVNNVINDFQMLSNLQFVENRVYDEEAKDPEPSPISDQPKSKEQREAEMVPRIIQALEIGISVLDRAFERIEVEETSESEDDEDISQGRTILEPKDMYEHRPLPYIIGSEAFQRDDHAGLHNLYEEDLSTDTQDENISASAESEDESEEESDFEEKELPPRPTIISTTLEHKDTKSSIDTLRNRYSESESSDLFDAEEEEGKEVNGYDAAEPIPEDKPKQNAQTSLMEELMRKTKPPGSTVPPSESSKPENIQPAAVPVIPVKVVDKKYSEDLFASSDSFFEDDDSPFRKKTGLFSADGPFGKEAGLESSLFDEDEDKPVAPRKTVAPKAVVKKPATKKKEPTVKERPKSPGLFDDDEESDLFSSIAAPLPPASKVNPTVNAPKVEKSAKQITSSPIQPEKKISSSDNQFGKKAESSSLFGEDSDDDLFSKVAKPNQKSIDFGALGNNEEEGDDDDDLFSTKPASKPSKIETNLLVVEDVDKKDSHHSLFEESDSFDLFKPSTEKAKPKAKTAERVVQETKNPVPKIEQKVSSSLFEESDSFDLFSPPKEAGIKKQDVSSAKQQTETKKVMPSRSKDSMPSDVPAKATTNLFEPLHDKADGSDLLSGFDQPISEANTLSAINKDRVKIQTKRRKPTRKGRQAHISTEPDVEQAEVPTPKSKPIHNVKDEGTNAVFSPKASEPDIVPETPGVESLVNKPQATFKKNEQSKKNLMSQLISEAAISRIGKKPALDIDSEDDLFSDKNTLSKALDSDFSLVSPTSSKPSDVLVKDSLESDGSKVADLSVLSDSTSDDDLFSAPAFNDFRDSIGDRNSIFDDDDDIFKPLKNKDGSKRSSEDIAVDADDDDIFAGVDKEKYEMFPTQQYDDDDDDDEDDIFSNIEKTSQVKPTQGKKTNDKRENVDLFSDPLGGLALND